MLKTAKLPQHLIPDATNRKTVTLDVTVTDQNRPAGVQFPNIGIVVIRRFIVLRSTPPKAEIAKKVYRPILAAITARKTRKTAAVRAIA